MTTDPPTPGGATSSEPGNRLTVERASAASQLLGQARRLRPAPRVLTALQLLAFAVALVVVGYVAVRAGSAIDRERLSGTAMAAAVVAGAASWLALGRGWASVSGAASPFAAMSVWTRTQVLRYFPGGIWAPTARAVTVEGRWWQRLGAVVAENVTILAVALSLGGVLMAMGKNPRYAGLAALVLLPTLAAVLAGRFGAPTPGRVAAATGWYLLSFAAYAVSALCAQAAVGPVVDPATVAGAACLAWAVGLVIVVPGGLGAREVAYMTLVGGTLGGGLPAAGALAARLASVVAELAVLAVVGRPHRRRWG